MPRAFRLLTDRAVTQTRRTLTLAWIELAELQARLSETNELIIGSLREVAESQKLLHQLRAIEGVAV
jgi:hypothetical protein